MKVKDLIKDVQDVELTPEQEKQIKDYLGIKGNKRWKPKNDGRYYTIYGDLSVDSTYNNTSMDSLRIVYGNCFKTEKEAEFAAEKIKVYLELKNFADENNDPINWSNPLQEKFYIMWDYEKCIIIYTYSCWMKTLDAIYFSSKELAKQAVETVGADRIKKYLFGVE